MKKLGRLTLKELGSNFPPIPQAVLEQIKGGDVTVTFDRSAGTITIFGNGIPIGCYSAANNTGNYCSWPDGTFSMMDQSTPRGGDSFDGSYGTMGGYAANAFYDTSAGHMRDGMMIHAGRGDDYNYGTQGCIRTTAEGIGAIDCAISNYGNFTSITVIN